MRSEEDVRIAIQILGASFAKGRVRQAIWGANPEAQREAWGGYLALGWITGANNLFQGTLEYATVKLIELAMQNDDEKGDGKNGQ